MKNKEEFFINQFKSKYIGDDGAFIDGFVYAQDSFFEDIHFKRDFFTLYQIAAKSMLINISDAIVMNAKVKYILLSCAIDKNLNKTDLQELARGFKDIAKKYNIEIIGGDTIANDKLHITITTISKTKNPIYRKGIKQNHLLAFSGSLGSVAKELKYALRYNKTYQKSKFITPKLHPKFFYDISKYISSSIDISDGLFKELDRLSKINKIGFLFDKKISKDIGCSGEEYEILFSFDKKYKQKIKNIAKKHKIKLNIFAKATKKKPYKCICKENHF
jgi:thiamine-monophosphate kinase